MPAIADYYKVTSVPIETLSVGRPSTVTPAYAFMFNNLADIERYIDERWAEIRNTNGTAFRLMNDMVQNKTEYIRRKIRLDGAERFGTTQSEWVNQPLQVFLGIRDLEQRITNLTQRINKVDVANLDQKPEIQFTDEEKGIFSFDLASLGLYKMYEYYSPLLQTVVSPNFIRSYKNAVGTIIFYHIEKPAIPRHECKWSGSVGGFYSPVLERKVEQSELETELTNDPMRPIVYFYPEKEGIPRHDVQRKQQVDKHGKPRFSSTWKRSFIYIPKVEKELNRIDLIIPLAYRANVPTREVYWNAVAVLSIAQKLSRSNIRYRIIASRSFRPANETGRRSVFCFIKVKDENEALDINALSLVISDTRFYRYKLFLLAYSLQYDCGFESTMGKSVADPISDVDLIKAKYIEFLSKQESESDRAMAKLESSKIVVPVSFNEAQAEAAYQSTIRKIQGI